MILFYFSQTWVGVWNRGDTSDVPNKSEQTHRQWHWALQVSKIQEQADNDNNDNNSDNNNNNDNNNAKLVRADTLTMTLSFASE